MAKLLFRHAADLSDSPAEILRLVNADFRTTFRGRSLLTAMGVALDPASGELTMAGAGHPPLLIKRSKGVEALRSQCPPLGLQAELAAEEEHRALAPGEGFFLFTDGFYDVTGPDGVRMEMSALEAHVRAVSRRAGEDMAESFLRTVLGRLRRFRGGDTFADDLAAVAVFRSAEAGSPA